MAIAKKPRTPPRSEQAAERFIAGAALDHGASTDSGDKPARIRKTPVMMRLDPDLLARIDKAAAEDHTTRTAWITRAVVRALREDGR